MYWSCLRKNRIRGNTCDLASQWFGTGETRVEEAERGAGEAGGGFVFFFFFFSRAGGERGWPGIPFFGTGFGPRKK